MIKFLVIYYAVINIWTFILFAVDKSRAKRGKWRISEAALLGCCFIGGALGGFLSMQIFRHKTKHLQFTVPVPIFLILHIALFVFLALRFS